MEAKFNTDDHNSAVVQEIIEKASNRAHWLIFCSGVAHSEAVAECLRMAGIPAEALDATHSKSERERKLDDFESGKLRALCNVGILTTGYDFPALDCIAFLRSTMSPGLYLQMAVRGMRPNAGKVDCLVLDFAGVVESHGPITNVQPPKKGGDGNGEAPVKVCDHCGELVHISVMVCPSCGEQFPEPVKKSMVLRNDDIMGLDGQELEVTSWTWRKHISKASGIEMLAVTYYGGLSDTPITEYLPIMHEGYAGQRAMSQLLSIANSASIVPGGLNVKTMEDMVQNMNNATPPEWIEYRKDGKFFRVMKRSWE
jgi:DNA repair protein RadD